MAYIIFGVLELTFWIIFLFLILIRIPNQKRSLINTALLLTLLFPLGMLLYKLKLLYSLKCKFEEIPNEIQLVAYRKEVKKF
jgi:hypothetical protein